MSEGGFAVALAECCIGDRDMMLGATVDVAGATPMSSRALFWGEAQGRVLISSANAAAVISTAQAHGIPARVIGQVTAELRLVIRAADRILDTPLVPLADAYFDAIPALMQRAATATA
jgi:phosphoribosylformylglycinamidine (FGAM) synthase-like enzyme